MTETQIKYVLGEAGYTSADWNDDMDLTKFSIIFLDQDSNLFPDKKTTRYKFNWTDGILEVYAGKMKANTFYYNKTDRPNYYISFDLIAGFIQNSKILSNGQIMYREPTTRTTITPAKVRVIFKNYDGSVLSTLYVESGSTPSYNLTPTKPDDDDHIYTFSGWSPAITTVSSDIVYTAQFTAQPKPITVNFYDESGTTLLQTMTISSGSVPVYTEATPTKQDTEHSYFNFTGWRPSTSSYTNIYSGQLPAVTASTNYYAVIDEYERMDWIQAPKRGQNSTNLLSIGDITGNIAVEFDGILGEGFGGGDPSGIYDAIAIGNGKTDCSIGVNQANTISRRIKNGWTVLENSSAYNPGTRHTWRIERNTNNIKFIIDGTTCEVVNDTVAGNSLTCYLAGNYRPANSKIYFAKAYSNNTLVRDLVPVQCVRTELYGLFDIITTHHKPYMESGSGFTGKLFEVKFLNYDGTELQSNLYQYKSTVSYIGSTPIKSEDDNYTYTFSDWSPTPAPITGRTTYIAQYTATAKIPTYTYIYKYANGENIYEWPLKPSDTNRTFHATENTWYKWTPGVDALLATSSFEGVNPGWLTFYIDGIEYSSIQLNGSTFRMRRVSDDSPYVYDFINGTIDGNHVTTNCMYIVGLDNTDAIITELREWLSTYGTLVVEPKGYTSDSMNWKFTNWTLTGTTYTAHYVTTPTLVFTKYAGSYKITLTYPDNSTANVTQVNDNTTVKYLGKNNEFITTSIGNTSITLKSIYNVVYNGTQYPAGSVITTIKYYDALNLSLTATITN